MAPVLGYWKIRGLVQRIRLLLAYTGDEFEDKAYVYGPAPDFDRSDWLNDKEKLGLCFPNLPYYIDGDIKITQSAAIIRHIARKNKLEGTSEEERVRVDMFEHQLYDLHSGWANLCYNPNFAKLKGDYLDKLPGIIEQISEFLGKRKFFAGDNVTFVDFIAHEYLSQQQVLHPSTLANHSNLQEWKSRVEALPHVGDFVKSSPTYKYPLNGAMASFGNE